jgi:hypothetical protein
MEKVRFRETLTGDSFFIICDIPVYRYIYDDDDNNNYYY